MKIYEIAEYQSVDIDDPITHSDWRQIHRMNLSATRLKVTPLGNGIRVRATSFVGELQCEHFVIRVVPKIVGGTENLMRIINFSRSQWRFKPLPFRRDYLVHTNGSLFELFVQMVLTSVDEVMNDGVVADYVEEESPLPYIRGRLMVREQMQRRSGRNDAVWCRYDSRETDIWENQHIAHTLGVLSSLVSGKTRRRVLAAYDDWSTICRPVVSAKDERSYNRQNDRYRQCHGLCDTVLDQLGLDTFFGSTSNQSGYAFFIDMNAVFESFVGRAVRQAIPEASVKTSGLKDGGVIWDSDTDSTYRNIIPDVLVRKGRATLPIDSKYKLYGEKKVSNADVYQLSLYARTYRSTSPNAMIIYPHTHHKHQRLILRDDRGTVFGKLSLVGITIDDTLAGDFGFLKRCLDEFLISEDL